MGGGHRRRATFQQHTHRRTVALEPLVASVRQANSLRGVVVIKCDVTQAEAALDDADDGMQMKFVSPGADHHSHGLATVLSLTLRVILITILRLTLPLILFRESRELHIFFTFRVAVISQKGETKTRRGWPCACRWSSAAAETCSGKWEVGSGKWERQAGRKKLIELFVVVVVVVSVQQSPPSQWISLRPRLSQFTGSKAVGLWRLSHGLKSAMCFSEVFESGPDGEWLWWGGGWMYLCCDRNGRVPRTGKGVVGPS
ncbi:hypothetical protein BHE74_00039002 [Ensete ventricosum]|nr:hypothetical protein BHE74_00039002 [Ensete ventricosum]